MDFRKIYESTHLNEEYEVEHGPMTSQDDISADVGTSAYNDEQ